MSDSTVDARPQRELTLPLRQTLSASRSDGLPRLRGVLHRRSLAPSVVAGLVLVSTAGSTRGAAAAALFATGVTAMLAASALNHREGLPAHWRARARRLDHAAINLMLATTWSAVAIASLDEPRRTAVLAVAWGGAGLAAGLKLVWLEAPGWLAALIGLALGWSGCLALPELATTLGTPGFALLLGGGVLYTIGAVAFSLRWPNPTTRGYGYHEIFHALVVAGAASHYATMALFVLPAAG